MLPAHDPEQPDGREVEGQCDNNTIEGLWNLVKSGINGAYFSVCQKHMQSYLREFEFRYNLHKHPHMVFGVLLGRS